jgi:putative protein-disulfide isomerase
MVQDRLLIYIGDPMCSWCWGFVPVLDALWKKYGNTYGFRIVLGGLRPGPQAEPMDDRMKDYLRNEWAQIKLTTGQSFDFRFLEQSGFIYNTDIPSRAVVAMRRLKPDKEYEFFKRLQRAFYAENTDITDTGIYTELVTPFGVKPETFLQILESEETVLSTENDYAEARRMGISGFPSIVVKLKDELGLLTYGYQSYEKLDAIMQSV